MTGVGATQECSLESTDISVVLANLGGAVAVQSARRTDGDSGEAVLRHTVDYEDGEMVVVEQQDCQMANLRVTLLSPAAVPGEDGLRRFGEVLGATPVWSRHFSRYDPVEIALAMRQIEGFGASGEGASQILRSMDDTVYAADESSEVTLTFVSSDSHAAQFRSMLTLYIGVGGL